MGGKDCECKVLVVIETAFENCWLKLEGAIENQKIKHFTAVKYLSLIVKVIPYFKLIHSAQGCEYRQNAVGVCEMHAKKQGDYVKL